MPVYRLKRHVIVGRNQDSREVWGINRPAPGLETATGPRDTDVDDPLQTDCPLLLRLHGRYVTWNSFFDWLSFAEDAGYELVSGYEKLSPYSTIIIRGP